jgi:hypothetical protein
MISSLSHLEGRTPKWFPEKVINSNPKEGMQALITLQGALFAPLQGLLSIPQKGAKSSPNKYVVWLAMTKRVGP